MVFRRADPAARRKAAFVAAAKPVIDEARSLLGVRGIAEDDKGTLNGLTAALEGAVGAADAETGEPALKALDDFLRTRFPGRRLARTVWDWISSVGVAVTVALALRLFVFEPFKIPSASMYPTLHIGDHIFVNKFVYGIRIPFTDLRLLQVQAPRRGEVVVFVYPGDGETDYIKRIVGLPGDTIRIVGREVYVNGARVPYTGGDAYEYEETTGGMHAALRYGQTLDGHHFDILFDPSEPSDNTPREFHVGPEQYFVMGDNRDNSADSRRWGFVPAKNLKGRSMFIWWNWYAPAARIGRWIH